MGIGPRPSVGPDTRKGKFVDLDFVPGEEAAFDEFLSRMPGEVHDQVVEQLRELGESMARKVKNRIWKGLVTPPKKFPELTPDPRTLIRTKTYVRSIGSVAKVHKKDGVAVEVVPRRNQGKGRVWPAMARIGRAHEYGLSSAAVPNLPARPHWRPVINRLAQDPDYRKLLAGKWLRLTFRG